MLLFRTAVGKNSVIYSPTVSVSSLRLKTWGAYDSDTNTHSIVVLHKNTDPDVPVSVKAPISTTPIKGQVIVLTAPSIDSVTGMSIAGLQLYNSTDGLPVSASAYVSQIISPDATGAFNFVAKAGSVTLLKIYLGGETPGQMINLTYSEEMTTIIENGGGPSYGFIPGSGSGTKAAASGAKAITWTVLPSLLLSGLSMLMF